jgi:type IV pilus assembly protein PilP
VRRCVLLAAMLSLAACGDGEPDLRQELRELSTNLRGRVDPLPAVRPSEPAVYRAARLPDPFYPEQQGGR